MNILLLLGPPGSGKGTQAVALAKALQIPHISTGDLFRDNMRNLTPLGQKAKSFIDAGKLVPDPLVLDMLFDRLQQPDCRKGYLLDGFPRTLPQAEALDHFIDPQAKVLAINLNVPDEVIAKRAEGRLTCRSCGLMYNNIFRHRKIPCNATNVVENYISVQMTP